MSNANSNVATTDAMAVGEDKVVRYTVTDDAGVTIDDFTGWTFAWFLLSSLSSNGTIAQLTAAAKVTKTTGSGIDSSTPPYVDVTLAAADTAALNSGNYGAEIWRTDTGNVRRLSYGAFPILD